ncbi:MAG: uracil-DNA glycosylase [Sphingobacteriales bacterium]|jgi:uracil-DNA glycosylase|nr:MAG: uracil-DNA glycosylase [Sphingobacteriales bacterium]
MLNQEIQIEDTWKQVLADEFEKSYFQELKQFLLTESAAQKTIFPKGNLIFNAYNTTPFDKVKVVIIGQDPYHGIGQAHGLCFSVQYGVAVPPSLKNIYKEIKNNYPDFEVPTHGCLQEWAAQGVFLLNSILTVEANKPASHQKRGWENFTDASIEALSKNKTGLVFLLWGNFAQQKASLIDEQKHYILKAAHPSPFSAYNGFFWCQHFIKTNELLLKQQLEPINWQLQAYEQRLF